MKVLNVEWEGKKAQKISMQLQLFLFAKIVT
jgi:hypothetical protein